MDIVLRVDKKITQIFLVVIMPLFSLLDDLYSPLYSLSSDLKKEILTSYKFSIYF